MNDSPDDRSAMARAAGVAYSVIAVCLEMVIPMVVGFWLDQYLGTVALMTILGTVLGLGMGIWGLLRVTESLRRSSDQKPGSGDESHQS